MLDRILICNFIIMKYTSAQILALTKSGAKKFSKKKVAKAASDLGRSGGMVGGYARAEVLSYNERFSIAQHAANKRWRRDCDDDCPYCLLEL
jgi:hypothetical protein